MSDTQPTSSPSEMPDSADTAPTSSQRSTGEKVRTAAYMTKCVLVGLLFLIGGVIVLVTGSSAWWVGLIGIAYGLWVLSGLATGGWRLFIY